MISETASRVNHFLSAGMMNHGDSLVEVASIASVVGLHIIVPKGAFLGVAGVKFPVLFGHVDAFEKSFFLLFARDIEEEFQHMRAVFGEHVFPIAYLPETHFPDIFVILHFVGQRLALQNVRVHA